MWWRRNSAWCCRARPMRCPTAMPAPSAASARSPSPSAPPSSSTCWRPRCWRPGGRSACASGSTAALGDHVGAKDVALRIIAEIGVAGARGHAVEYAGAVVRAMAIESRLTLCNLAIEMGARSGFVAPDDTTFSWISGPALRAAGRVVGPRARLWRKLASDDDAQFDRDIAIDCDDPRAADHLGHRSEPGDRRHRPRARPRRRRAGAPPRRCAARSNTWGSSPGTPIAGLPVDRVFIGSCTNARLPDLVAAAAVVRGRRVADGVVAMVVPGSSTVKRAGRGRRARPRVPRRRLLLGRIRLLDVRRRQRRPRQAGRALRVDHQPQFREPPGHRCAHPSGRPGDGGRRGGRRPHRRRAPPGGGARDEPFTTPHRRRRAAHPRRHQHRRDHADPDRAHSSSPTMPNSCSCARAGAPTAASIPTSSSTGRSSERPRSS